MRISSLAYKFVVRLTCRRLAAAIVGVVVISAMAVTPAAAQIVGAPEMPPPPPKSFGQVRLGSLFLTPDVTLTRIGIDTNALAVAGGGGAERQDLTATVRSEYDVRFAGRTTDIRALTRLDYVYYARFASERSFNPSLVLSLERRFSPRLLAYAQASYMYPKDRPSIEIDSRMRRQVVGVVVGGVFRASRLVFDVHGSENTVTYANGAQYLGVLLTDTANRTTKAVTASAGYTLTPLTTITLKGQISSDRFPNSAIRAVGSWQESVGFSFRPRALIAGEIYAGYRKLKPLSNENPGFSGFTPGGSLSYKFSDTTVVQAGGSRDLDFSYDTNHPYYELRVYNASVNQALFHRFDVMLGWYQTSWSYRSFLTTPAGSVFGAQTLRGPIVNVGVKIRGFRFGVYATQYRRVGGSSYTSNRIGIQITRGSLTAGESGVFLAGPPR